MKKLILIAVGLVILTGAALIVFNVLFASRPAQPESYAVQQARDLAAIAALEREARAGEFWLSFWQVVAILICLLSLTFAGLVIYWRFRSRTRAEKFELWRLQESLNRLEPDSNGNYPIVLDRATGAMFRPAPGNFIQAVPTTLNYSPHITSKGDKTAQLEAAQVDQVAQLPPATVPTFAELIERGEIGRDDSTIILGFTQNEMTGQNEAMRGTWKELYSSAIAGVSGSGKTTTTRFLVAQAAIMGARFVAIDPHGDAGNSDSLVETLKPLAGRYMCNPAVDDEEIEAALFLVKSELKSRKRGGSKAEPLLVLVDELTSLMRGEMAGELSTMLQDVAQEGRKFGIYALAMGQIWKGSTSGGTELRDSFASFYVHRLKRNQARMLLPTDEAVKVEQLPAGRCLLFKTNGDLYPATIPLTTGYDLELLAGRNVAGMKPESSQNVAIIEAKPANADDVRVLQLFKQGNDVAAITKELYGLTSSSGGKFQKANAEVQEALRRVLRG